MNSFRPLLLPVALAFVVALTTGATAASSAPPPVSEEASLIGRLATVEPARRRLTIVPDGDTETVDVVLAEDGEIAQGGRELSLPDLVILTGSRVKVRYRLENGRRIARRVTLERSTEQD